LVGAAAAGSVVDRSDSAAEEGEVSWDRVVELAESVPAGVWVTAGVVNVVLSIATWSAAGRRLRRAGLRFAAGAAPTGNRTSAKDAALTVAAMVPAILFWGMVLAGSFHGLVEFGRQTLGWRNGWEYLVPGTLDGVSVTFAFLAFRAVRLQKSPVRCQRVVWGAAVASAIVNFAYEYSHSNHNVVAGGYLALLSLFGMVMFHEFLNQFEDGAGYVNRESPAFGLRWLTWPTNTFCAAVAWRNYPPEDGTAATVRNAIANLDRVRALKAAARNVRIEARHQQTLTHTRRRAELASAAPRSVAATATAGPVLPSISGDHLRSEPVGDVKVPATASTVSQWAAIWVNMCADGDFAAGPISDDQSRDRYRVTARQLRNIRHAATSGALRRRAEEMGIDLPPGYTDKPVSGRLNGHHLFSADVTDLASRRD
jgi:hypothetical protein